MSVLWTPIGSVGVAALPVCETTVATSGKPRSTRSMSPTMRSEASRLMLGSLFEVTTIAPSESCGMNSPPRRVAKKIETANSARATPPVIQGCAVVRWSSGV